MRGMTIKSYANHRFAEGAAPMRVWQEVREIFPLRCCGWGYVLGLHRAFQRPTKPTAKVIALRRSAT